MFSYKVKSKQQTNQQTSKPGNTKELQWQQKEQWQQERGFWLARSHHTMKYIRETGETHSKLLYHAWSRWSAGRSRYTQMVRGKKSLHNAWSRWSAGSSRYTMHNLDGPWEEVVTQCSVQGVLGKKSLHNAWSRWSAGRSRCTMHDLDSPWEEAVHNAWSRWSVGIPVRHGGYG